VFLEGNVELADRFCTNTSKDLRTLYGGQSVSDANFLEVGQIVDIVFFFNYTACIAMFIYFPVMLSFKRFRKHGGNCSTL
jgi:hypothetical protein